MKKFLLTTLGVVVAVFSMAAQKQTPPKHAPQIKEVYGYVTKPETGTSTLTPAFYKVNLSTGEMTMLFDHFGKNGLGSGAITNRGFILFEKPSSFSSSVTGYIYNTDPWGYATSLSGSAYTYQNSNGQYTSEPFFANDVTWNVKDNKLYACTLRPQSAYPELSRFDISGYTLARESVGGTFSGAYYTINGLAANSKGELYGITTDGTLYAINTSNGSRTEIENTGLKNVSSATFNLRNDVLYVSTYNSGTSKAAIYTVDTETAVATQLCELANFPDGIQLKALAFDLPAAPEKAPDAPFNFTLNFPEGAMSGQFVFDTPSTLYDGTEVSGNVTYEISVDDNVVTSGTTQYGLTGVAVDYTFTSSGKHNYSVVLKNDAGSSPKASIFDKWIGYGVPATPSGVKAEADGTAVTISWNAVTEADYNSKQYGAFFDPTEVVYSVVCSTDNNRLVAENITGLNCVDDLGELENMVKKTYNVYAHFRSNKSSASSSVNVMIGSSFGVPYSEDFTNSSNFSDYFVNKVTVQSDYGGGYNTFSYTSGTLNLRNSYSYETTTGWAFTPKIRLKAGITYTFSMQYWNLNNNGATLEVKAGKEQNEDAMNISIVESFAVSGYQGDYNYQTVEFTVDEDGEYSFGINFVIAKIAETLYVDNIEIYYNTASAPMVPELTAACGENNQLSASGTVTAPVMGADKGKLSALDHLTVKRGETVVLDQENPEPGKTYNFSDTLDEAGTVIYTATATNSFGESDASTVKIFVGNNLPAAPVNLTVTEDTPGTVTLSWTAPELDPEGNELKDTDLTYTVFANGEMLENYIDETSYVHKVANETAEGKYMNYQVFATNSAGDGEKADTDLVFIGNPATGEWTESFANGSYSRSWAFTSEEAEWQIGEGDESLAPFDADKGILLYNGAENAKATVTTIPHTVAQDADRYLSFYYNSLTEEERAKLTVTVTDSEGEDLLTDEISPVLMPDNMWIRHSIDMSAFAGKTVRISLGAEGQGKAAIDMMKMSGTATNDIVLLGFEAPAEAESDADIKVKATVANLGDSETPAFSIMLKDAQGETIVEYDGEVAELPFSTAVTLELPAFSLTALDPASVEFKLVAEADDDVNADNGVKDVKIAHVLYTDLATVAGLKACKDADTGYGVLEWKAPSEAQSLVGYNVWREGELLTETPITDLGYIDSEIDNAMDVEYAVTAVYADNHQSLPVYATVTEEVKDAITGVDMIGIGSDQETEYYDLQGRRLMNPAPGTFVIRKQGNTVDKIKI